MWGGPGAINKLTSSERDLVRALADARVGGYGPRDAALRTELVLNQRSPSSDRGRRKFVLTSCSSYRRSWRALPGEIRSCTFQSSRVRLWRTGSAARSNVLVHRRSRVCWLCPTKSAGLADRLVR